MRIVDSRILATGVLLALTLTSGLWLSLSGKPYSTAIFTIHKLIALGAVIVTGITINHLRMGTALPMPAFLAILFAAVFLLSLFISGALLSIAKPDHVAILVVHRAAPLLAAAAITVALHLLVSTRS